MQSGLTPPVVRSRNVVITTVVMLAIYWLAVGLAWLSHPAIAEENALMENLQAGSLALACVLFLPGLLKPVPHVSPLVCWSLLLLYASMFLREVDVETLGLPDAIVWVGSGTGRNLVLGTAFAMTGLVLIQRRITVLAELIDLVLSPRGLLLICGGCLYVSSIPFDKHLLGISPGLDRFCEELIECGATFLLLSAAALQLRNYAVVPAASATVGSEPTTPVPASRQAA